MPFEWTEYLALARRLAKENNEAAQRSAISRAYYSVYHSALSFLEQTENFSVSFENPAHKQVWDRFRRLGRTHAAVGLNGDRLRVNRAQADYYDDIRDLPNLVDDSFDRVDKVSHYLDQIGRARI